MKAGQHDKQRREDLSAGTRRAVGHPAVPISVSQAQGLRGTRNANNVLAALTAVVCAASMGVHGQAEVGAQVELRRWEAEKADFAERLCQER